MASTVGAIEHLCIICWRDRPTADDVRRVAHGVLDARRAAGRALVLVAIAGPDLQLPRAEARRELGQLTPVVDQACEAQFIVIAGADLRHRAIRGLVATVLAVMRAPATLVDSVDAALERACARAGLDPAAVRAAARDRGLLPPGR